MIQKLSEKYFCHQSTHYEKYGRDFCYEKMPSSKSTLFTFSKDEWNTKEDAGKSMKNALDVLWCAKRHLLGQSDVEQSKNQACSHSCY